MSRVAVGGSKGQVLLTKDFWWGSIQVDHDPPSAEPADHERTEDPLLVSDRLYEIRFHGI
jgi:hypothetical protein